MISSRWTKVGAGSSGSAASSAGVTILTGLASDAGYVSIAAANRAI
jgi:hypothetical protein